MAFHEHVAGLVGMSINLSVEVHITIKKRG